MKVLITGGSGLVGNAIMNICNEYNTHRYIFMSSKDCNLLNYQETLNYFNKIKPDYVIHLAAKVGGLFKNMNYKVDMFTHNITINNNVLQVCHELHVKKVVSCLSTCIFPNDTTYPINETMLHCGAPHHSNDAYAYAKRMLEVLSKAYRDQYNDNFICIIPTNIYGPYDNFNLEDSHVIPGLIYKCYLAKQNNLPFVVAGTGIPLRQFIYSEDLARLILWSLFDYNEMETIILSPNENSEVSISMVADIIANAFNYNNIEFDKSKSDGQYKKTADNSKLMKYLPDFQFTTIESGLIRTIKWFNENIDYIRK
jgi:GDP-L-fucose synthase